MLAWRITPPEPGQRNISVFSLESGGAVQVTWRCYKDDEVAAAARKLVAQGHRVGTYSDGSDHVWVIDDDDDGITLWDDKQRLFVTERDTLRTADGTSCDKRDIETVVLFADDDNLGRGIRARMSDGKLVDLAVELRWTALSTPHYNRDDLVFETEWATEVGVALSRWAGSGYDDQI